MRFFLEKPLYSCTFALPKKGIPSGRDSAGFIKTKDMSKLHFTTKHANAATVQHNWYVKLRQFSVVRTKPITRLT
ncbi:MAG: hypothetical protein RL596_148 [Bacteroidota bacterium]